MRKIKNKNIKWWIGVSSCTLLFLIIGFYSYLKMSFVVHGVEIQAHLEKNGNSPIVAVKGNAKNAIRLELNGREIDVDENGAFSEQVALEPGLSVMSLSAIDKFGKTADKKIDVMYEETGAVAARDSIININ
jgi:hypothetical protein